jgi:hypothetical protein
MNTEVTRERLQELRYSLQARYSINGDERDVLLSMIDSHLSQPRTEGERFTETERQALLKGASYMTHINFEDGTERETCGRDAAILRRLASQSPQPPAGETKLLHDLKALSVAALPYSVREPIDRAIAALTRQQGERVTRAFETLAKLCEMDDPPDFKFDFDFAGWTWILPEDQAGSFFGSDGRRQPTVDDFCTAVETLARRLPPPYTDAGKGA